MTILRPRFARTFLFAVATIVLVFNTPAVAQLDVTAPTVQDFAFSPQAVDITAADQTVTVTLRITDQLSGFNWGCFRFGSPTGSRYVAACIDGSSRISGSANDGVYQSSLTIQRGFENGIWHFYYGYMWDQANNLVDMWEADFLARAFPTTLQVTAQVPDVAPPAVRAFALEPQAVDITAADQKIAVTVRITDDLSGFNWGCFRFSSPSGVHSATACVDRWARSSGNANDGIYQADLRILRFSEAGTWHFSYGYLWDQINNLVDMWEPDLLALGFPTTVEVSGAVSDINPPVLQELSLTPSPVNISDAAGTVTLTARLRDNVSGVNWGCLRFSSPTGVHSAAACFDAFVRVSGDANDGIYQATLTIPRYSEPGVWHIYYGYFWDQVGNLIDLWEPDLMAAGLPTTLVVTVNQPPVAEAGPNLTAIVGETVAFDGSASFDSDGTIALYHWAFGDDANADGTLAHHAYAAAGHYTVTLTVTDDDGATAGDTMVVTVLTTSQAIASLSGLVAGYNLRQGIANSLDTKLQNALAALQAANAGQRQDAANKLLAFLNAAEAQRGKELTTIQADELIALARRVLGVI